MPHAEANITIARPVKAVYDFVLKGENNGLWRPSVVDVERVPKKPAAVGAVFKQGLKGFLGRRIAGDYEVIQCVPSKSIKFRVVAGPARPIGIYTFKASGGTTTVTFRLDLKTKGFRMLMDPMINRSMKSEVATLANLKTYLESQA
jgi:hypothetical protein